MAILKWTPARPPGEDNCRYDHCIANTPFGRFLITWKSWKEYDYPTVDETPWGDWYETFHSVQEAQRACEDEYRRRLQAALAEPEPERLTVQEINDLPQHRENYIYSGKDWDDEIQLDGHFSRADLQQLANSAPTSRSN